jgi:hypothetical protein
VKALLCETHLAEAKSICAGHVFPIDDEETAAATEGKGAK